MMRAPRSMAVAVRKPGGEIAVLRREIPKLGERWPILRWPVVRGAAVMIQALVLGISSLNFSAEAALDEGASAEGEATGAAESVKPDEKKAGGLGGIAIGAAALLSIGVGLGLFFLLPLVLTDQVKRFVPALQHRMVYNLVDGAFRIVVFLSYLLGISMLRSRSRSGRGERRSRWKGARECTRLRPEGWPSACSPG